MYTYTLVHIHSEGHTLRYFKSTREDLDGLSYSGEEFGIFLEEIEHNEITPIEIQELHPQWEYIAKVINVFGIKFDPFRNETIILDMIPPEIDLNLNGLGEHVQDQLKYIEKTIKLFDVNFEQFKNSDVIIDMIPMKLSQISMSRVN